MKILVVIGKMLNGVILCISFCLHGGGPVKAQQVVREKVFLHTSKNYFHAGEVMWFSAYLFNSSTKEVSGISRVVYVQLLDSANKPLQQGVIAMRQGRGNGSFVMPDVPPGMMRLVAYTNWMRNFSEDDCYVKNIALVNARLSNRIFMPVGTTAGAQEYNGLKINVKTDQQQYGRRKKVRIDLETLGSEGGHVAADLSMSVYKIDSLTKMDASGFGQLTIINDAANPPEMVYPLEHREQWVYGRVMKNDVDNAVSGANVYLTVPGYASGFYNTVTDSAGRFRIGIRDVVPAEFMIIKVDQPGSDYRVEMESPFVVPRLRDLSNEFVPTTAGTVALTEMSIAAQVERAYNGERLQKYLLPLPDTIPFYGEADFVYHLDDYTRFSKMEEVFREYVAPVAVNKRNDRFMLSVYELKTHNTFAAPPLVLLDGYAVDDINRLFLFDPLRVKRVEVVNRKYIRGNEMFYGIVNLVTYSHDLNGFQPSNDAVILRNQVVQKERRFISPEYVSTEAERDRLPDFRNVLYWSPAVATGIGGKVGISFYTSDLAGEYVVVVHGVAAGGKTGSAFMRFVVE